VLNDRPLWLIARNVLRPVNYQALFRMRKVYERPLDAAGRYFLGRGTYPCTIRVRTRAGWQRIHLFNSHDAITVHEIFCRGDYECPEPPQVVVDIGSNIGISALYFLTESSSTVCELYEPDPRNIEKLRANLTGFEGRYELHECAVSSEEGILPFKREETGRYGGLQAAPPGHGPDPAPDERAGSEVPGPEDILVEVVHINSVIAEAVERHGDIDLLKVDTEGLELATVHAIDRALLGHVRRIVIEWFQSDVSLSGFTASSSGDTVTFVNSQRS